jgi:maleylacetate reductase
VNRFEFPGMPARVVFGPGGIERLPDEIDRLGLCRVVVLSTPGQQPLAANVATRLGDRALGVHPRAVMHVPVAVADAAVAHVRAAGADGCVTVGGGSATGLGKAIARETGLPLVALPTTYSGSEMTPVWGVTGPDGKRTGRDPRVAPRTVVYDPDLTTGLPLEISVTSAINAMAHAVEAGYAPDRSPVTDLMAASAATSLLAGVPALFAGAASARSDLLRGAWLAGNCLATTAMGLHHKLCHIIGGLFDLDHAWTHTVLLPYVMGFNTGDDRGLSDLLARHGLRRSLADLGMPAGGIDKVVAEAAASPFANPEPAGEAEVRRLVTAAYHGHAPAQFFWSRKSRVTAANSGDRKML